MKNTKKLAAMIAALTLSACSVAPMFSFAADGDDIETPPVTDVDNTEGDVTPDPAGDNTTENTAVTIALKENDENYGIEHTYYIYQIFTGTYTVDEAAEKLDALKWGSSSGKTGSVTPAELDSLKTESDIRTFISTLKLGDPVKEVKTAESSVTIQGGLPSGYYYITDETDTLTAGANTIEGTNGNKHDAKSAIVVQIVGGESKKIEVKKARPSIDKTISDDEAAKETGFDGEGFHETADHAINEEFQFKLEATIPADEDLTKYETYYFEFKDTFSEGVTFDKFDSLTVTGVEGDLLSSANWTGLTETADEINKNKTFSVKTTDIKAQIGEEKWGKEIIKVTLTYTAHLNENAKFQESSFTDGSTSNVENNYATLVYSNNPEDSGEGQGEDDHGETPKDYAWPFTYVVNNTKVDKNNTDLKLAGAKFTLADSDGNAINVKKVVDKEAGTDEEGNPTPEVYHYVVCKADDENVVEKIESAADGTFNIVGLDAGSYVLTETDAPTGYAKPEGTAAETNFTISADHKENEAGDTVTLQFYDKDGIKTESAPSNTVENSFTSSLPSTGGMGTTLFYLGGGAMVAVAGVFLITKKRMGKSEN